jgi:hypothetical protein
VIKAQNIIEDPPTELAFLLWQWLQEEPFQFEGRMVIIGDSMERFDQKIVIYGPSRNPRDKRYWYVEIACIGPIAYAPTQRNQSWWPQERMAGWKEFNVSDPQRFEDLLAYIKWLLPK